MNLSSPTRWNLLFMCGGSGAHDLILEFPVNTGGMTSLIIVEDEKCPAFQETVISHIVTEAETPLSVLEE
jgi:hypothetical protein